MKTMSNLIRLIILIIVIAATVIVGYTLGKRAGKAESQTIMTSNYSFIREIAELGSLEVNGITTFKSTNVTDDNSWAAGLQKAFLEKTVQLQVPFTAKYGVNLADSSIRTEKKDTVLEIHLPKPSLLSYELRLDRMQTNNHKGLLQFSDEDMYTTFQKKMYQQNRAQLEQNQQYLQQSQSRIAGILQRYFAPLHIKVICIFDGAQAVTMQKS